MSFAEGNKKALRKQRRDLEEPQEMPKTCDESPFIGPVLMRVGVYGSGF